MNFLDLADKTIVVTGVANKRSVATHVGRVDLRQSATPLWACSLVQSGVSIMPQLKSPAARLLMAACVAISLTTLPACRQFQNGDSTIAETPSKPWWKKIVPSPQKVDSMLFDERSKAIERSLDRNGPNVSIR